MPKSQTFSEQTRRGSRISVLGGGVRCVDPAQVGSQFFGLSTGYADFLILIGGFEFELRFELLVTTNGLQPTPEDGWVFAGERNVEQSKIRVIPDHLRTELEVLTHAAVRDAERG